LLNAMMTELAPTPYPEHVLQSFRNADGQLVRDARTRVFNLMDQDHDGGLSADELQRAGPTAAASAADLVSGLDLDADGKLDQNELTATRLLDETYLGQTLQKLQPSDSGDTPSLSLAKWLLPQADADQSGALSPEEYAALGRGGDSSERATGAAFRRADLNGDGQVSADELSSALEGFGGGPIRIPKGNADKLLQTALKTVDTSGDGALSKDELVGAFGSDGADALIKAVDKDADGKLSSAELSAAVALRPDYYGSPWLVGGIEPTACPGVFRSTFGTMAEKALHSLVWSVAAPAEADGASLQDRIKADFDRIKDMGSGPIQAPTKNWWRGQIQDAQSRLDEVKRRRDVFAGMGADSGFSDLEQILQRSIEFMGRALAIAPEADGMFRTVN
jgi:Ca2+-binding EF-hand superfamily protein